MTGGLCLLQIFEQVFCFFLFGGFLDVEDLHLHIPGAELDLNDIPRLYLYRRLCHLSVNGDSSGIAGLIRHSPPLDQA